MNKTIDPRTMRQPIGEVLRTGRRSRRSARVRRGVAALVAVAIAAGLGYWFLGGGAGQGSAVSYVTEPASRAGLTVLVTATGSVQPTNQVDVSSELSGIVRDVSVDYNSHVTRGQVLATLDNSRLAAIVASARARVAAAKAQVTNDEATVTESRLDLERKRTLASRNIASKQDLDLADAAYQRALAAVEASKAQVQAAEADLAQNETDLSKTSILSPISGVVLARNVEPGQTVASSLQAPVLFTIAEDLAKMEVEVDVDEADVGKVSEGQQAAFTVDAYPDRTFDAKISQLRFGSEVVQGVVTYKAVLTADNSDLLLRPGMTATAEITVDRVADALTVPNAALRFSPPADEPRGDRRSFLQKLLSSRPHWRAPSSNPAPVGNKRSVWVLADGKPKQVPVAVGVTDGRRTQIVEGAIRPGEAVIVDTAAAGK